MRVEIFVEKFKKRSNGRISNVDISATVEGTVEEIASLDGDHLCRCPDSYLDDNDIEMESDFIVIGENTCELTTYNTAEAKKIVTKVKRRIKQNLGLKVDKIIETTVEQEWC